MRAVIWFVFAVSLAFPAMGGSVPAQSSDEIDSLNRQVEKLHAEGKNAEALPMAERYVALTRQRYGEESAEFATAITWLGSVYESQGRYSEAEALLKRALLIRGGRPATYVGRRIDFQKLNLVKVRASLRCLAGLRKLLIHLD